MLLTSFNNLEIPATLRNTDTVLTAYDNKRIKPVGVTNLLIKYKNSTHHEEFFVVDFQATTILGLPTCIQLDVIRRLDTFTRPIKERPSDGILAEYADVFMGLGCFLGKYNIVMDTNFTPVINAPRRVPLSLQLKLEQTLEAMVRTGMIIKRDKPTGWVSSLLLVEKPDGTIRLCLDLTDLNRAIKREHYTSFLLVETSLPNCTVRKYLQLLI